MMQGVTAFIDQTTKNYDFFFQILTSNRGEFDNKRFAPGLKTALPTEWSINIYAD